MGVVEESIQIENKILSNRISKEELVSEIMTLENKYGEDAFLPYNLTIKDKPWSKAYYDELIMLGNAGACSKEFLFHLIEVRDYLKNRARIIAGICVLGAILVTGIIVCLM